MDGGAPCGRSLRHEAIHSQVHMSPNRVLRAGFDFLHVHRCKKGKKGCNATKETLYP